MPGKPGFVNLLSLSRLKSISLSAKEALSLFIVSLSSQSSLPCIIFSLPSHFKIFHYLKIFFPSHILYGCKALVNCIFVVYMCECVYMYECVCMFVSTRPYLGKSRVFYIYPSALPLPLNDFRVKGYLIYQRYSNVYIISPEVTKASTLQTTTDLGSLAKISNTMRQHWKRARESSQFGALSPGVVLQDLYIIQVLLRTQELWWIKQTASQKTTLGVL